MVFYHSHFHSGRHWRYAVPFFLTSIKYANRIPMLLNKRMGDKMTDEQILEQNKEQRQECEVLF